MSEYAYSFDDLRGDILGVMQSMGAAHAAQQKLDEAMAADLARLWADNAELRDELHALANRVETLTRARLAEPAEVAAAVVKRMHEVRLRPRSFGDGAVAVCNCGWRSEEMATDDAALAHGHVHVREVTANA